MPWGGSLIAFHPSIAFRALEGGLDGIRPSQPRERSQLNPSDIVRRSNTLRADRPNRRRHPKPDLRCGLGSRPGAAKRAAEGGGLEADAQRRNHQPCRRHHRTPHNVLRIKSRSLRLRAAAFQISQIPALPDSQAIFTTYFCCYTRSRFSPRSGNSRRNIWSEARALQCPQRAYTEYAPPNGHPRSLPAPSPRWATRHPRERNRANVSLQKKIRRPRAALTNETARPNAKCCAGSCRASSPARRAPCQSPSALQSLVPNPSIPKPS